MSRLHLLILLLISAWNAFPQSTNISTVLLGNTEKADYFFDRFAYRNALEIYLHQFDRDPDNHHIRERIARCYLKLQDPVSAELWYGALAGEPGIRPDIMLRYAGVLTRNAKYHEAIHWFVEYLKHQPTDKMAREKLAFLESHTQDTSIDDRFVVSSVEFNSGHSEFGAQFFHRGVVFASSRDKDLFIKRKPLDALSPDESLLNLYYVEKTDIGEWVSPVPFNEKALKTYYHEGPMAFYDHFRKCAFTQSNLRKGKPVYDANGKVNLQIFFAAVSPTGALEQVTPFAFNSDAYSNAHPSLARDGSILYFSSTMPTGIGGSDLYYSTFSDGRWTDPVNVGDAVNTREDELFPFIANDTTLYFSSNGHGTFGGLDVFVSHKRNGVFGRPVNLGGSMNSRFDDFSLVCDSLGRTGFVASNADEGMGHDDIYHYAARFYLLAGEVLEINRPGKRLADVRIMAFNSNGDLIDSARSDASGHFILDLPFDQDFKLTAEKDGFEMLNDLPFSTKGKPFGIDSLALPLWRQNLFSRGRIFSSETQSVLPGADVILHNLSDGLMDTLAVDGSGEYVFPVKPGRRYRIEGVKEGYIPSGFNLDTQGMVEGELLNDIVLEEVFIDKELILFEYDRDEIAAGAATQLENIVKTMLRFPRSTLSIGAHADSRGTYEYNTRLSKNRAESTRDYLLSRGIRRARVELRWFGEELILNRCSDGVECPEEEHSKNRRAELKVQIGQVD